MKTFSDAPVMFFIFAKTVKANGNASLSEIDSGLKILSWVTLTCQFKSGPGHQVSTKNHSKIAGNSVLPRTSARSVPAEIPKSVRIYRDIQRHLKTFADAPVMRRPILSIQDLRQFCHKLQHMNSSMIYVRGDIYGESQY